MEICLSKRLKSLRQERGITQEELAEFLKISSQAVSKWERNEGYPDISLLPKIAGYFHTTVDDILGVDQIVKQERIDAITEEYNKLRRHIPLDADYKLDEGIELIRNALKEIPGDFFFEQLLAADLTYKGQKLTDKIQKQKMFEEAIILCEDILSRSTEDRWRDCAHQILLVIYSETGNTENALKLAYQLPGPRGTRDNMLTYILKGEALIERYKLNAVVYYQLFSECIIKMQELNVKYDDMLNRRELTVWGIPFIEYIRAVNQIINRQKF